MKTLLAALILSSLAAPVLALTLPAPGILAPATEDFGRRSGRCPHHPEVPAISGQAAARERSTNTCGGV